MASSRTKAFPVLFALVLGAAFLPALADEACLDFKWDVSKERALFAETPTELTGGKDPESAPIVVPNRLYKLRLMTQPRVAFPATPGKKVPTPSGYAGLATLKIPTTGSYRISVDLPVWIDVVSNGALVQPTDYQGQHQCRAPHKIVEFSLAGGQVLVLQISNAVQDGVLLAVTPSPQRKL